MSALDHVLWAAPDLEEGVRLFEAVTGLAPAQGGSHPGFGTRNSLLSLGDGVYFEIIAPDPAQRLEGNLGAELARLPHPGLFSFAIQTTDIDRVRCAATEAGLGVKDAVSMSRRRPDGVTLAWTVQHLAHPGFGRAIPFAIDWGASPHPSTTTPKGCTLRSLTTLTPEPEALSRIYRALGIGIEVRRAPRPGFLAVLASPKGEVTLLNP